MLVAGHSGWGVGRVGKVESKGLVPFVMFYFLKKRDS
jgi:hypothetical protein